ncbi:MAG: hypothetical protein ABI461_02455, partial [Polyangiaceae bacterium]
MTCRGRREILASRARSVVLVALASAAALVACAHDELPPPQTPHVSSAETAASGADASALLRMYVLADTQGWRGGSNGRAAVVALGGSEDGVGVIQDGLRLVSGASGIRAAAETTEPPIIGGVRMPSHLGGGFLFQTQTAIYTSPSFDGLLHPLVTLPGEIGSISFGPQGILVRGSDGQRWYVDAKTGRAAPMNPPGLVDIASLGDGRAAAIAEFGSALISIDGGTRWQDVTHQLPGPPTGVVVVGEELYFTTSSSRSDVVRVDAGGSLVTFDAVPTVDEALLRKRDPRWVDKYESPIRHALRLGVPLDDHTALVADGGNVDTVDLMTGELLDVSTGKLPPEATCEPVRTHDDILFVCNAPGAPPFVASHVLGEKPVIEQTFGTEGIFYAGDDGALAFGGECSGTSASLNIACVRTPSGTWKEYNLADASDAGGEGDALRWVPRADGGVIAIVNTPKMGTIDAHTGEFRAWDESVSRYSSSIRGQQNSGRDAHLVDRNWTTTPAGGLRGWVDGGAIDVSIEGTVAISPFKFERDGRLAASGPYALASHEGRLWQTVDRGSSWVEVAVPLSPSQPAIAKAKGGINAHVCSAVGCDLISWYRIGWSPVGPALRSPPKVAGGAPHLVNPATPTLICKIEGATAITALPRSDSSPDDFGLGLLRLPLATNSDQEHLHTVYSRTLLNPPHSSDQTGDPGADAVRALLYGYGTSNDDSDRITVLGPNKDPMALRRMAAFVPAFDPAQIVRKTSFGINDIVAAGRGIGLGTMDVLAEDPSIATSVVPVLATDPTLPADLMLAGSTGMLAELHASNAKPRVTMRVKHGDDTFIVSAAAVGTDDLALLEMDVDGSGHVMKWSGSSVADLFDVPAPPSTDDYPANPDAIAISARSDVAVLRMPSGGVPPSQQDPALIYGMSGAPIALAPWSTMTLASDPACHALAALPPNDPNSGWRAIIQTARPWISINAPGLSADEDVPTLMRVRWTTTRVCLEAAEIRLPPSKVRTQMKSGSDSAASPIDFDAQMWLVARFTGVPSATRASIMLGSEMRQS